MLDIWFLKDLHSLRCPEDDLIIFENVCRYVTLNFVAALAKLTDEILRNFYLIASKHKLILITF